MALSDALTEQLKGHRCLWRELLDSMPEEDRVVAEVLMDGGEYEGQMYPPKPIQPLRRDLRAESYTIGKEPMYEHRRGQCSCP